MLDTVARFDGSDRMSTRGRRAVYRHHGATDRHVVVEIETDLRTRRATCG